jgi:hypothetical protein
MVNLYACARVCVCGACVYVCMYLCAYICMYIMYVCIYVCNVCIYIQGVPGIKDYVGI